MAPKSSITAKAVKNIFRELGTRFPNSDKIPTAKAISVAIGIPAPAWVPDLKLNNKNKIAGISIPPTAPKSGNEACFILESSPWYVSRFNSKPISRKKMVISPSLIQ